MNMLDLDHLLRYWTAEQWQANVLMLLHLLGATILGLVLGYERAYHGRAAGMRTYALVCVASCGVIILLAYPHQWYGGSQVGVVNTVLSDPTRVIQGVLTGVGFLCAGVIMREGMNISGLTTAASMWAASAIGIVVGMGFYYAAIMLTFLCAGLMMWGGHLEGALPSHPAIAVMIRSQAGHQFDQETIAEFALLQGYRYARGSLSAEFINGRHEWRFVCTAKRNRGGASLASFAANLPQLAGVEDYRVTHARN